MKIILPNLTEFEFTPKLSQYTALQLLGELQEYIKVNTQTGFQKVDDYFPVSDEGELISKVDNTTKVVFIVDKSIYAELKKDKASKPGV